MRTYPHIYNDPLHNLLVAKFEVEYEDILNLKELYKTVFEWTEQWGFKSVGNGQPEFLYMELVGGNGAKNHHVWWRFKRDDSNYFRNFLKIDFQTLNVASVELMLNGKKVKTNKGDIIIRVEGWLMLDYKEEWKNNSLLSFFDKWFVKRWYKKSIEAQKKELWFEVYNLQDTIKQFLDVNTRHDLPHAFKPKKGI